MVRISPLRGGGLLATWVRTALMVLCRDYFSDFGVAAAEFATFVVLGIVFVVLLWKNRIFTESFWKPITRFFCCGRRSQTEVVEAVEIYPTERPAADVYREVRRRRIENTDVESVFSETSFVNFFSE